LRKICENHGLTKSGKKSDLVTRLLNKQLDGVIHKCDVDDCIVKEKSFRTLYTYKDIKVPEVTSICEKHGLITGTHKGNMLVKLFNQQTKQLKTNKQLKKVPIAADNDIVQPPVVGGKRKSADLIKGNV
jgi:hypothetical protein